MKKIEKLSLEKFKEGTYGVYINNVLLVLEIKHIDYEGNLVLWLPNGGDLVIGGNDWSLQGDIDIESEDFDGIVEDELHFKDHGDNTIIITNNPNKF